MLVGKAGHQAVRDRVGIKSSMSVGILLSRGQPSETHKKSWSRWRLQPCETALS
jgi:hypothetical protein